MSGGAFDDLDEIFAKNEGMLGVAMAAMGFAVRAAQEAVDMLDEPGGRAHARKTLEALAGVASGAVLSADHFYEIHRRFEAQAAETMERIEARRASRERRAQA